MLWEKIGGIKMALHNGEFCFEYDCTFSILDENNEEKERDFRGGAYYHIDSIKKYPDGFSDILFTDNTLLFQVKIEEVGSWLGTPKITQETEALEGEVKERN
jgi:hypothetical protein